MGILRKRQLLHKFSDFKNVTLQAMRGIIVCLQRLGECKMEVGGNDGNMGMNYPCYDNDKRLKVIDGKCFSYLGKVLFVLFSTYYCHMDL